MEKLQLRWGVENEFVLPKMVPGTDAFLIWKHTCGEPKLDFDTDASCTEAQNYGKAYWAGYEIKTPKTFLWQTFPKFEIRKMIEFMTLHGAHITATCGLHFHFSGIELSVAEFGTLKASLEKVHYWPTRQRWVNRQIVDPEYPRYQVLRDVSVGHYEARVFNASLSYHGIFQPWSFLNRLIQQLVAKRNHEE